MSQINECERDYVRVHGRPKRTPSHNMCRRLLIMGCELTPDNIPIVCINHCERWGLGK